MSDERVRRFREMVWDYYRDHGRDLPWRHQPMPYQVLVSEVMLQQTQVSRVLVKYTTWLRRFPDWKALAEAQVAEVITAWQGLGYNRRALWLQSAARAVMGEHGGQLPRDPAALVKLPGIGPNTAGSIAAFAYEVPAVFVETNIRRVFIHHYEELTSSPVAQGSIADAQLRPLIEVTLDREQPREWYYALMDYGADLAKRVPNPNRRSKHYSVQSKFEGSTRQLRGEVLRRLIDGPKSVTELDDGDERLADVLQALMREGFIHQLESGRFRLR